MNFVLILAIHAAFLANILGLPLSLRLDDNVRQQNRPLSVGRGEPIQLPQTNEYDGESELTRYLRRLTIRPRVHRSLSRNMISGGSSLAMATNTPQPEAILAGVNMSMPQVSAVPEDLEVYMSAEPEPMSSPEASESTADVTLSLPEVVPIPDILPMHTTTPTPSPAATVTPIVTPPVRRAAQVGPQPLDSWVESGSAATRKKIWEVGPRAPIA